MGGGGGQTALVMHVMHVGKPPPPCGQTHTCENITLPQTSFAGGNNVTKVTYTPSPDICEAYFIPLDDYDTIEKTFK